MIVQNPLNPTAEADSMVSVADARARAVALGVTLPTDDTALEVALVQGNVYLNSLCYYGSVVVPFQMTSWPRNGVVIGGNEYPSDQIPQQAIDAQIVSAAYAASGEIYTVVDNDKRIKRKKIDVIETEYFGSETGSSNGKKVITRANELLAMFTCSGGEFNWAYLGQVMTKTYFEDYQEALATLKEDGFAVSLIKKGLPGGGYDENGDIQPAEPDIDFAGFGITTGFSSWHLKEGIAQAGDVRLIFAPEAMSAEYITFYNELRNGGDRMYAQVNGELWRVVMGEEIKPTTMQIIAKLHLRR